MTTPIFKVKSKNSGKTYNLIDYNTYQIPTKPYFAINFIVIQEIDNPNNIVSVYSYKTVENEEILTDYIVYV